MYCFAPSSRHDGKSAFQSRPIRRRRCFGIDGGKDEGGSNLGVIGRNLIFGLIFFFRFFFPLVTIFADLTPKNKNLARHSIDVDQKGVRGLQQR